MPSRRTGKTRAGMASKLFLVMIASVLVVGLLVWASLNLRPDAKRPESGQRVRVYCASGLVKPVQELIQRYNQKYDANVEIVRTGGSGELAGQIKTEAEASVPSGADLYITADHLLLEKAFRQGIVAERFALATQKPVIAVAAKSELVLNDLNDLCTTDQLRFGIASTRAAVGKMTREIAKRDGFYESLESRKTTDSENVMTLAQALVAGSLDAAVIWDTTVAQLNQASPQSPQLRVATLADNRDQYHANIAVGVIASTEVATASLRFARYMTAPETGKLAFSQLGFSFVEGDHWEERPEIHLYCGSMFTPVLENAVSEFAKREGVYIYPRWEGCGKLVASMESIEDPDLFPDGYLACDVMFLDQVAERFQPPTTISNNQIVIAVREKWSGKITRPEDLLNSDLRVGICDPDQSALGRLTQIVLSKDPYTGVYEQLKQKSAVTVDVGPTLVSQLLAGGLDAAIVYRSNVMAVTDYQKKLRMVELDAPQNRALARQPWAISRTTKNAQLMHRFLDWINQPQIQEKFQSYGFEIPSTN